MKRLRIESGARCTEIVIERPILDAELIAGLKNGIRQATRPLVIRSEHPRIFLAGADLGEISGLDQQSSRRIERRGRSMLRVLDECPVPVVALVEGATAGGGFDFAMGCDLVVCGPRARFAHPGVSRGLITVWKGTRRLGEELGPGLARAVMLDASWVESSLAIERGWAEPAGDRPDERARQRAIDLSAAGSRRLALFRSTRRGHFVDSSESRMVLMGHMIRSCR